MLTGDTALSALASIYKGQRPKGDHNPSVILSLRGATRDRTTLQEFLLQVRYFVNLTSDGMPDYPLMSSIEQRIVAVLRNQTPAITGSNYGIAYTEVAAWGLRQETRTGVLWDTQHPAEAYGAVRYRFFAIVREYLGVEYPSE